MEKLFDFLTKKVGYTAFVILGFLFPGMLFVFIWNRSIYIELGIIRLLILAISIIFAVYAGNFLLSACSCFVQNKIEDEEIDRPYVFGFPVVITNVEVYSALIYI